MNRVVLVSGVDYYFHGVNFAEICDRRLALILNRPQTASPCEFTVFNFSQGTARRVLAVRGRGGWTKTSSTFLSRTPITKRLYTGHALKTGDYSTLSAVDIYLELLRIGKDDGGGITEFSVFSHSGLNGAILANSFDRRDADPTDNSLPKTSRDPNDVDMRTMDFLPRYPITDSGIAHLRASIAKSGAIRIWGCLKPPVFDRFLRRVENHPAVSGKTIALDQELRLVRMTAEQLRLLRDSLACSLFSIRIERDTVVGLWRSFLSMIRSYLSGCFPSILARTFGCPVWASPLGGAATYDAPHKLMWVGVDSLVHCSFYTRYFNTILDPEHFRYMLYPPQFRFKGEENSS